MFGKSYDVITVGSGTVDIFLYTEHAKVIRKKKGQSLIAYPAGGKILVDELITTTGGGGTNAAASLSKLGYNVAFLGKLGDDHNAELVLKRIREDKVDFLGLREKKGVTSLSVVLDSVLHDRTILVYKGASSNLKFSEINKGKLMTKWFYFSAMLGEGFKTLEKLAGLAAEKGIRIAFNPSAYLAEKGLSGLGRILRQTNILVLNEEEAQLLAKKGGIGKNLRALRKAGPEIAVITQGKNGATAFDGKYFYRANSAKAKVVETTGAGDAFASSFMAGIMRNKGIEFSMQLGMANSASVLSHHGAKTGLLSWKEAVRAIHRKPVKVYKKKV